MDLTIEQPVRKEDLSKLTKVPVSVLAQSEPIEWISDILTHSHSNKAYERILVRLNLNSAYIYSILDSILYIINNINIFALGF